jgi:thiol:disulfide interchange protein
MKKRAFNPIWLLVIVFAGFAVFYIYRQTRPQLIPWRDNLSTARTEASNAEKPLFLYFTATWCGPCQRLKHTTWSNQAVATALDAYVPVEIDVDAHPEIAQQYRIEAMPTFVVINHAGDETKRMSGAYPPDDFLKWLKG